VEAPVTATVPQPYRELGARRAALVHARAIAIEAGAELLERFGRLSSADVGTKSSRRDLVTSADLAAERIVTARLREHFPGHAIQAEEETREEGRLVWYVDPLDGTVNFVHRLPFFCVSMALYADDVPLVAVVHAPRLCETFTAVLGGGAFLGEERLAVSHTSELEDALLATGFPYRRSELSNGNLGNLARVFPHARGLRRMGSAALDLAYCAAGRLDAFWELHLARHDLAAGALLVREAGGVVCDLEGGDAWLAKGHLAAGPRALVEKLMHFVHTRPEAPPFGPPFTS
jgi:myo-inositol-1(or 4)-monophosphatase